MLKKILFIAGLLLALAWIMLSAMAGLSGGNGMSVTELLFGR